MEEGHFKPRAKANVRPESGVARGAAALGGRGEAPASTEGGGRTRTLPAM